MLDDELDDLRRVAVGGTALEIDKALLPLIANSDPRIISPILLLLNESSDQDGMWSILHVAESFDGPAYVKALLKVLPELRQTCLWWAKTLLIRILNSDEYRADLVRQLRDASVLAKEAVAVICGQINEDARFHNKTAPVLTAIKA
ncbi:MAG: Imm30 family immunity protein [Candidatus Sphingomonas phytovorans]|nr:Imm30 family immunity protein [Sphingomonas sp.]WEK00697.1 MAG: Imm30 family immunity protein [Sphingomonas sp.]